MPETVISGQEISQVQIPESMIPQESNEVCESWQQMVQAVLGVVLLVGALAMVHYYAPMSARGAPPSDLQQQVHHLTAQVEELEQEQAMPAVGLNRYRNSIGDIYGVYQVGFANQQPAIRARGSRTGVPVGDGRIATDRPGAGAWTADVAVLRAEDSSEVHALTVLHVAKSASLPGELVTVLGYPMGIAGMVAKSPTGIYERLAYRHNDITAASELAALSLIRPSATCGHLGDVVGDKLIYDAPTAHGGSGGPVFNARGEVIGVNSAYMDGFSGGTLGVAVESLRPLIERAQRLK